MSRVTDTTWADYVRAISDGDTGKTFAAKTGQSESAVSRWKSGASTPDPRQVVIVARAYARNPIEALIAAGFLTRTEADLPVATPRALQLRDYSDFELATEMLRRVDSGEPGHELLDQPLDSDHPAVRERADTE